MSRTKSAVKLTEGERKDLRELLKSGVLPVRTVVRALVLLRLDEGMSTPQCAAMFELSDEGARKIALRYRAGGLEAAVYGTALLAFDLALARSGGRPRRPAQFWFHGGLADQLKQARARVVAVALLGAVALRDDDEDAVSSNPPARQTFEPSAQVRRQRRRMAHVKAQLHRGCKFIDILAAGTGCTHERFRKPPIYRWKSYR